MQQDFLAICSLNHEVRTLCNNQSCKRSAVMCTDKQCTFSKQQHPKCTQFSSIKTLNQCLNEKQTLFKQKDYQIETIFDEIIKLVKTHKEQFTYYKPKYSNLTYQEKDLLVLLSKGASQHITPSLVKSVIESLKDNNAGKLEEKESQIVFIKEKAKEIEGIIAQICSKILVEPVRYKFDLDLSSRQIDLPNQLTAEYLADKNQKAPGLEARLNAMMIPKIFDHGENVDSKESLLIKVKILEGSKISLGLSDEVVLKKSGNLAKFQERIRYTIDGSTGVVKNFSDKEEDGRETDLRFSSGDTVEMYFNKGSGKLIIANMNNFTRGEIRKVKREDYDQLYFCVEMMKVGDSVEILQD